MPVSPEALSQLVVAHAAKLELYARQLCDSPADAVQEAFLKLAIQTDLPTRVVPWLFEVTRHRALSLRRAAVRRRRHESNAARQPWFEPNVAAAIDAETISLAIESLSQETREVVVSQIWGGLTFEEIGELTGTSSSTAHRRYIEGLQQLRKTLGVTWLKTAN